MEDMEDMQYIELMFISIQKNQISLDINIIIIPNFKFTTLIITWSSYYRDMTVLYLVKFLMPSLQNLIYLID